MADWQLLLRQAYDLALKSPDPSTQNGALLINKYGKVLMADFNQLPPNIKSTDERWQKPLKYKMCEHAERNVIYSAACSGIKTFALTMVCPWMPCCDCARAIIVSGIKRLVTHQQAYDRTPERWKEDQDTALAMLKEAGVEVVMFDGPIGGVKIRFNGALWEP